MAPGEGIVCSCPLGMELGPDNHTCQIQSYCAKHLKCSQKCDQNKFSVKCSCYEGWVLEPDGESCRSLGKTRWSGGTSPGPVPQLQWAGHFSDQTWTSELPMWAKARASRDPGLAGGSETQYTS